MGISRPTATELIETLRRSSLDTVIVEGEDDASAIRRLEELYGDTSVDFLVAGNRHEVCEIFKLRAAVSNIRIVFLVDSDLWVFDSKPAEFDGLLTTEGYSIENDLLMSGGPTLERLMNRNESLKLNSLLSHIAEWFARAASDNLDGLDEPIKITPQKLLIERDDVFEYRPPYDSYVRSRTPKSFVYEKVVRNQMLVIRGKTLLGAYAWILSSGNRVSKFSRQSILDLCIACAVSPNSETPIHRLLERIRSAFVENK